MSELNSGASIRSPISRATPITAAVPLRSACSPWGTRITGETRGLDQLHGPVFQTGAWGHLNDMLQPLGKNSSR